MNSLNKYAPYGYILAGMAIFSCMGTIYSWSIFRSPLEGLLGIGATESGWPYMLFLCFYALAMPFAGPIIEKIGPRRTTLLGGLILSTAWFASGSATGIISLSLTYGVLGGTGVGVIYGAPLAVAARWFPRRKGLAVGLTLAGFGVSPFLTAPLAMELIARYGVLSTFRIFGLLFLVCISLLALFLKFPQQPDAHQPLSSRMRNAQAAAGKSMFASGKSYGLWCCYAIGTFAGPMAISVTSPVAQEVIRLQPETAALAVSVFALFNAFGRPLFGFLTDKFGEQSAISASFFIILAASILLLAAKPGDTLLYFVAFSLLWLALGGWLALAPVATANLFGEANFSRNYGFVFTAYGAGALLGGLTAGMVKDHLGSYQYAFYVTALLTLAGLFVNYRVMQKKTRMRGLSVLRQSRNMA